MLAIPRLAICVLVFFILVVPSLEKFNKFEILLFTNALGRHANVQRHENSKLKKVKRRLLCL
jgi:hypothetical protein